MLTVNDFFCGAGGMGLGFKNAGFIIKGAWDFDKYAVESYRQNVGDHVKQMDISQMTAEDVPNVDVWTFGFPCQDVSVAGKQAGMIKGETRSGLFYEIMRLLDEVEQKPKIILAENVKGVKKYLPNIEEEYNKAGYKMYYTLYNSKYWGVPQNRERYFMIGVRKDINKPFEFPQQQTEFVPKLSSVLETEVDEKFYIDNDKAKTILERANKGLKKGKELTDVCIDDQGRLNKEHKPKDVFPTLRAQNHGNHPKVFENITGTHACITPDRVDKRQNGRRAKVLVEGNTNPSGRGMNGNVYNAEGLSPTLTTNKGEGIKTLVDYKVRKLTPREYARLQGFPDSFKFVVSNTQLYKQFGNAVTVNVAEAIANQIKEFLT